MTPLQVSARDAKILIAPRPVCPRCGGQRLDTEVSTDKRGIVSRIRCQTITCGLTTARFYKTGLTAQRAFFGLTRKDWQ